MVESKKYCLCCGEGVPYNVVVRHERRELTCAYCGFTLGVENLWEEMKGSIGSYAIIAEDSKLTRVLLKELLLKKEIVSEVTAVSNGLDLVSEYSRYLNDDIRVSFAIIDLNMPVMDGLTAARTLRVLEEKKNAPKVPIVFFSSVKADEGLKRQMELLAPANYVNKGSDSEPEKLAHRVQGLLNFVSQRYQKA